MTRIITFAATTLLLPQLAFAQTVVVDPQLLAIARQSQLVQQQTLAVLDKIEAIEQSLLTLPQADAALTYAARQSEAHAAGVTAKTAAR